VYLSHHNEFLYNLAVLLTAGGQASKSVAPSPIITTLQQNTPVLAQSVNDSCTLHMYTVDGKSGECINSGMDYWTGTEIFTFGFYTFLVGLINSHRCPQGICSHHEMVK